MFALQNILPAMISLRAATPLRVTMARLRAIDTLHRERQRLSELDAHMLADIGITRAAAQAEATRVPWDAPANWQQK